MGWLITKYAITAALIVLISEVAKRSDRFGALLTALPLVSVTALIWLYVEGQPLPRLASYAQLTFWFVLPTLPMFLIFPLLLPRLGFWLTLLACALITILLFGALALALRPFGIQLW